MVYQSCFPRSLGYARWIKLNSTNALGSILSEYGVEDKNYDKLWEATHGLRRAPDGSLSQTVPNVDPKTAKTAVKLRDFNDSLYEYAKKIDRKALSHFSQI